ncbi:MAG: hypothetical protein ABIF82_00605 [Planctomycetota bacterium]
MSLYSGKVHLVEGATELTVETGGSLVVESGGYVQEPVDTASTGTTMKAFGVSFLGARTAKKVYTLAEPTVAGLRKTIYTTVAGTSKHAYVGGGGTVSFSTATTSLALRFSKAVGGYVDMVSVSTARWLVVSKTSSVTYTTGTTGA